ncbi:hypothetical protein S40285_00872 [Stachybotrys chlorohalonatus IBT 40285]|uniref:SHSP domain-containing protein n=1 Tax=Stachybotrys chlorohalonatus (strain IBT 40285) TaxID=1283841 RepID=A0A084QJM7_STAC4|nr:hypothetical protein S40285_00872 [Stachybotrys chlorohalonata IBT 40285]
MAFFPRQFYNSSASFTPLIRLLDDFDNYSRETSPGGRRTGLGHWQPKFDVRETDEAYQLHGELPGVSKENVNIEFSDPQTMLIRGKVERTYQAGTPPDEEAQDPTKASNANTEKLEDSGKAPAEGEVARANNDNTVARQSETKKAVDNAKYWLTERSIGEFARTFTFPGRVEQDKATADFKDGIINITVPKAKKHEARRVAIN